MSHLFVHAKRDRSSWVKNEKRTWERSSNLAPFLTSFPLCHIVRKVWGEVISTLLKHFGWSILTPLFTQINQTSDHCQIILSYILPFVSLMVKLSKRIKMAKITNLWDIHRTGGYHSVCFLHVAAQVQQEVTNESTPVWKALSFSLPVFFFFFFKSFLSHFQPISS